MSRRKPCSRCVQSVSYPVQSGVCFVLANGFSQADSVQHYAERYYQQRRWHELRRTKPVSRGGEGWTCCEVKRGSEVTDFRPSPRFTRVSAKRYAELAVDVKDYSCGTTLFIIKIFDCTVFNDLSLCPNACLNSSASNAARYAAMHNRSYASAPPKQCMPHALDALVSPIRGLTALHASHHASVM